LYNCDDIIMFFAYVSPDGSCYYNDRDEKNGLSEMYTCLENIKIDYPNTHLFLAGDLNSRCKDFIDYIPYDNLARIFGNIEYDGSTFDVPRRSLDTRGNNFGRLMLCI